jgi:hypothetical protein
VKALRRAPAVAAGATLAARAASAGRLALRNAGLVAATMALAAGPAVAPHARAEDEARPRRDVAPSRSTADPPLDPGAGGSATDPDPQNDTRAGVGAPDPDRPVGTGTGLGYTPPPRGAPDRRVGAGTRGPFHRCPVRVRTLAPADHVGLTVESQPELAWYLPEATSCRVVFALNDHRSSMQPVTVLEQALPGPFQAGVQRIRLAELGVRLDPAVLYEWNVALVEDPEHPSKDAVAFGRIERVTMPIAVQGPGALERARRYAAAGIWYDALAALARGLDHAPADPELRSARARLLEQGGLPDVARALTLAPR